MGLVLPQEVEVKITQGNHSHYKNKGYSTPTKIGLDEKERIDFNSTVLVNVSDLPYRSQQKVKIICNYCDKEDYIMYMDAYRQINSKICTKICCTNIKCKKDKATEVRCINADNKYQFESTLFRDKDWLYREYIIDDKSAEEISKETGIGLRTLRRYISRYNLATKSGAKTNFILSEELKTMYIDKRMTTIEIANYYGLCDGTITKLLRKYNIPIFSQSEQMNRYYYEKGGIEKSIYTANKYVNRVKRSCIKRGIQLKDFDGFITNKNLLIRNRSEYSTWRKRVFERDNYTCQCCGQVGGKLQSHHIENFSTSVSKRFDVDNGITMCFECHSPTIKGSFHSDYGKSNNNIKQLTEYIEIKKQEVCA